MTYNEEAQQELTEWQFKMQRAPGIASRMAAALQNKINSFIPQKVHNAITAAIKNMVKGVLFGATYITQKPVTDKTFVEREIMVNDRIKIYRNTGAAEGGITGAGGFFTSMADFPILLGIKMKMLFDIAAMYGYDVKDYRERLYMLYIFQLAFSSDKERAKTYDVIKDWNRKIEELPMDVNEFDWLNFQQQYRDYIDLAKLAQLLPVVGAAVGAIANYKLIKKLGFTAKQCYRMRVGELG